MTIKEVAKRTGLTEKTIRYYENQGFIHPAAKEKNGRNFRTYEEGEVAELKKIATLRKMRFTIEEIRLMREKDEDISQILKVYRQRIEDEAQQLAQICNVLSKIKIEEVKSLEEIERRASQCLEKTPLPKEDLKPDFSFMDSEERSRKYRSLYSIQVWPKKKLFPVRLGRTELGILLYILEGEHTFTDICHYCINCGIARDSQAVDKIVKKMRRKKVIIRKNQKFYPLVDKAGLKTVDVEQMVQRIATGSGSLMAYNWMPPMSVSNIPHSGI
ncbi:MAG: MerR family transcriptional regulator [Roseburia sp.]|nr:MerR family transcriptional regulator [Roseburia sp.]